jgi:SET domain-containing protein
VGTSTIANIGLGLFAGEDLKKNQLICTYAGEIIDSEIEIFRESLTQTNDFYNFALAAGESIDSRFIGNRSRFINHGNSGDENIVS